MLKEPKTEEITLYFRADGSDKVYQASLEPAGDLFVVNFAYGRRGSTMTTGTKTQTPLPYAAAKKAFDSAIKSKTAKGYTVGESGTPYQFTDKESRDSGLHPQLLNSVSEIELERLIRDDSYCMQEKHDGRRNLIRKTGQAVEGINRLGLTVGLPQPVVDDLLKDGDDFVIDGECIGDKFFAFDMLEWKGIDLRAEPYAERFRKLACVTVPVESVVTESSKRGMLAAIKEARGEGVVFKRLDAPYVAGRPASGGSQLKFKFVETASCIVAQVNAKRSIALSLYEGTESIGVGNCTIPPNYDIPKAGDVVEIRYLYAYKGGSLYQPVYQGTRDDIPTKDCVLSQLKIKPE